MSRARAATGTAQRPSPAPSAWLLLPAFTLVALLLVAPALSGDLISDDHLYLDIPYTASLSADNLRAIAAPTGVPAQITQSWAPVHLLAHALERGAFGDELRAYHATNAVLHAIVATLLFALLRRSGLEAWAAALGATLFLVHPANVEAVAWISQLKTVLSTALALGALLLQPARPVPAALLFGLALGTKPTAAFALPVALAFEWCRRPGDESSRPARVGLLVWAALLVAYAWLQLPLVEGNAFVVLPPDPDLWVRARGVLALWMRYLVLAATGLGASAFAQPALGREASDPWWIASLVATGLLAVRTIHVFVRRRQEVAWWIWAAAGFAPVAQIVPFLYPMADRYLYVVLPGLLGGTLLAISKSLLPRISQTRTRSLAGRALFAAGLALALAFGASAYERAFHWRSEALVWGDSARSHPDGLIACMLRAAAAARAGDAAATVRELRAAQARGFNHYEQLQALPVFEPVRQNPAFQALVRELARGWAEQEAHLSHPTQYQLLGLAQARVAAGDLARAESLLLRARSLEGEFGAAVERELSQVRARLSGPAAPRQAAPLPNP